MKLKIPNNTSTIVRKLIEENVSEGHTVLDSTTGNGNDTLALAKAVGSDGYVYGFDVQKKALEITLEKLKESKLDSRVNLIEDSHANIDSYIDRKLDFIIYNLGYLPNGDKDIKTNRNSTSISIKKALKLMNINGLLVITVYVGHAGGYEEKEDLELIFKTLNQKEFNVLKFDFINQINNPPILYIVERLSLLKSISN